MSFLTKKYVPNHNIKHFSDLNLSTLQALPSILGDDRFKVMFENPEYQVDEHSEEFRLLNPIVSKVGQKRKKKLRLLAQQVAASQQVMLKLAVGCVSWTVKDTDSLQALRIQVFEALNGNERGKLH